MNYLSKVFNLMKKVTWSRLKPASKVTLAIIAVMVVAGVCYWGFDLLAQLFITGK